MFLKAMKTKTAAVTLVATGLLYVVFNVWQLNFFEKSRFCSSFPDRNADTHGLATSQQKLVYTVFGKKVDSGHLKHVFSLLERNGYVRDTLDSDWNLLWAHEYPFRVLKDKLTNLKPYQKVNHFPGSGYITNKVNLATSGLPHVPVAFKIPEQKQQLIEYAKANPDRLFVQKSNNHRGIRIQPLQELDLETHGTFVQEYIHKPLLVDGHKFDIGVYTIITSIQPLRAYIYNGDILFRFCPEQYHPFDPESVDKYVVGDDYLPIWEVPSLKRYYKELGFGMKESFNAYIRSVGKDPSVVWDQVDEALRAMLLSREMALAAATSNYKSSRNFFEMMRVDFVIDEDLNVFIMEANMSPNLSSGHFPPNRLLYEQVLYNLFKLTGVYRGPLVSSTSENLVTDDDFFQPEVSFKDVAVFPDECRHCASCSTLPCKLCKACLTDDVLQVLKDAFREHTNRHTCKRIVPPALTQEEISSGIDVSGLTEINQLMHHWFRGKCLLQSSWCF